MKQITQNQARAELKSFINENFEGFSKKEIETNMFFSIDDVINFMKQYSLKK